VLPARLPNMTKRCSAKFVAYEFSEGTELLPAQHPKQNYSKMVTESIFDWYVINNMFLNHFNLLICVFAYPHVVLADL